MKIKQFIFSLLLLTIVIMGFINASKSKFYYAYGEKIYLEELQNKIIVRYNQNKQLGKSNSSLSSELLNKKINWKDDSTCVISVEISEQNSLKEKLLLQSDIKSCNSVFKISSDLEMGVVDEILVQFLDNVSQSEIEKFNKKFNTVVIKKTELYQLLKTPKGRRNIGAAASPVRQTV